MPPTPAAKLTRGDVVARGWSRGIVWQQSETSLTILPIAAAIGPFRRGDVHVDELEDLATIGLGGADIVIRCDCAQRTVARNQLAVGRISDDMVRRLTGAVARSAASAGIEGKWTMSADQREARAERCVRF